MKKNFVKDTFFLTNVRKFLSRRISSTKLLFMKNIILLCKFTKYIFNKLSRAKNFRRIFAEYFQYSANIRRKYSPNIRRIFATYIFAKTLVSIVYSCRSKGQNLFNSAKNLEKWDSFFFKFGTCENLNRN